MSSETLLGFFVGVAAWQMEEIGNRGKQEREMQMS